MGDQAEKLRALANQLKGVQNEKAAPQDANLPRISKRRARVITVSSGKGGVGKTNISINLGLALRALGQEVLLFDADLGLANVDVLLGLNPNLNLQHFMQGQRSLKDVITEGPKGLKVIASGNGVSQLADLSPRERERVLSHFSLIEESADVVIVDTGAGISQNVIAFIMAADECLVVTTPEPTARLDAYGLIKTLSQEGYRGVVRLIVNMVDSESEGREMGELMSSLSLRFLNYPVEYLGSVPRDRAVLKAVGQQVPFSLYAPGAPASKAVHELAAKLQGLKVSGSGDFSGIRAFLERLGSRGKRGDAKTE